jgi:hypothetical protein
MMSFIVFDLILMYFLSCGEFKMKLDPELKDSISEVLSQTLEMVCVTSHL